MGQWEDEKSCFETYNRGQFCQVILARDTLETHLIDLSWWNNNAVKNTERYTELQAVKIQNINHPFVLVNVCACNVKINGQGWQFRVATFENVTFCEDVNAKGRLCGKTCVNKQYVKIEVALLSFDLEHINDGMVMRTASWTGDEDSWWIMQLWHFYWL